MESKEKISAQRLRAKEIVGLAVRGEKYEDIADRLGVQSKPEYRRQAVYSRLQKKIAQSEMREIETKLSEKYTAEKCIQELAEVIELAKGAKQFSASMTGILGKAKVAGLLVDRIEDITQHQPTDDLSKAAARTIAALKVGPAGIVSECDNPPDLASVPSDNPSKESDFPNK